MAFKEDVKDAARGRWIKLSQGKRTRVCDRDYGWLSQWSWFASQRKNGIWYALRNKRIGKRRTLVYMHREILGVYGRLVLVDHEDRDGLNNVRENLRIVDSAQNQHNRIKDQRDGLTSIYKGVYYHSPSGLWCAQIMFNGQRATKYVGTEIEAAKSYDEMAKKFHGEHARCNL